MFTQIEHSHAEQLNKASNLTETAFKILNSKRRRRRSRSATNENIFNLHSNESYQLLTAKSDLSQIIGGTGLIGDEIYDGQIDVDSNYTGFLEILGMYIYY